MGEATPVTLYRVPAHERLRADNPRLKTIPPFRNPIDRADSNRRRIRRLSEAGGPAGGSAVATLPFGAAIRAGRFRMAEHVEAPGLDRWRAYPGACLYAEHVRHFRRFFPAKRFLPANFDGIRNDPGALPAGVAGFLDIDSHRSTKERRIENRGGGHEDAGPDLSTWRTWRAVRG